VLQSCSGCRGRDEGDSREGNKSVVEVHRAMVAPTILEKHDIASSKQRQRSIVDGWLNKRKIPAIDLTSA
jgi:hypothetical protein